MKEAELRALFEAGYSPEQAREILGANRGIGLGNVARLALGQGLGFGWGDEIEAFARSIGSDRPYEEIRDEIRAELERVREENPAGAIGLEIAGGALSGGVGAGRAMAGAAARSALRNAGRMAMIGGAQGALAGAGGAEGDLAEQAQQAAMGGLIGAPLGAGASAIGQALGRRAPGSQAGEILRERLGDETPEIIAARVAGMGPGATLMEASPSMRGMGAWLANRPGPTMELQRDLIAREQGSQDVIEDVLRQTMGIQGDPRVFESTARQARRAQAQNDYDNLLRMPVEQTPEMLSEVAMEKSADRAALRSTRRALKNAGLPYDLDEDALRSNAGYWDFFSRELKDRAITDTGRLKAGGAPLLVAKDTLDENIDAATGGYLGQVRGAYEQASIGLDAYKQADKFLSMPSDEAMDLIRKLDDEQRQLYAAGVTRSLLNKLESMPESANTAWALIKSPRTRRKMQALLGDGYDDWEAAMRNLMEQTESFNVVTRGSRTAPMMMQNEAVGAGVLGDLLRGDFGAAARGTVSHLLPGQAGMDPATAQALFQLYRTPADQLLPEMQGLMQAGYPSWLPGAVVGGASTGLY